MFAFLRYCEMKLKIFLITVFLLNLIQGIYTPVIDDEAYYWMWSLRLDTGYFDHPPMIALWIKLADLLFDSVIGIRFFTILFNTISAFFFWKLANPITTKERNVFSIVYFSLIFVQLFSFVSTPDAPLLFFTVCYLYILKQYIQEQSVVATSFLAICFAGLMYSKYHGILVLIFTLIPILPFLFKKYSFYLAVIGSLVLYLPHFIWLYENDFPPISYHFIDRSAENKFHILDTIVYLLTAIVGCAGLLFIYLFKGLKNIDYSDLFKRSVFWLTIGPFFFFFFSTFKDTTQAQWLLVSYVAGGLIIYWYAINQEKLKRFYYLGIISVGLILFARIVILIPGISPLYETKKFGESLGQLVQTEIVAFEKYQEASIFQFYNRDKKGVVYRTIGNRNSQFTLWKDEDLLNQPFTFVSPWLQSSIKFEGLKGKEYYLNYIDNYTPIHRSNAIFLGLNQPDLIELSEGEAINLLIELNQIDIELLKSNRCKLSLFITKDQQYNIVDEFPIGQEDLIVSFDLKLIYHFQTNFRTALKPGEYLIYIGLTPNILITKFQSKPIKLIITE